MPEKSDNQQPFEDKLAALESLVKALETGDVRLEAAVESFEQGMKLARECEQMLQQAELRIQQLRGEDENEHLADFDETGSNS